MFATGMATINIGGKYIATRKGREQLVVVESASGEGVYNCSYGIISSHECNVRTEELRELESVERTYLEQGRCFLLPQQFYQSGHHDFDSMDAHILS